MKTRNVSVDVVVVGAGAAGLMAATRAALRGCQVLLLEKNTKPGVKILMSGGTRCNITHATDRRTLADAFPKYQSRFLRAPLATLGPEELVQYFNEAGLSTKVESSGKVFPTSDRALDVQRTLLTQFSASGAALSLGEAAVEVDRYQDQFVVQTSQRKILASRVLLATGGLSYPGCGTTGDAYSWAKQLGHTIVPPRPALVPLKTIDAWAHQLSGLTLPDVTVSVHSDDQDKALAQGRGSMLLTHSGLSGPAAMNVSRAITALPGTTSTMVNCDLLPDVTEESLTDSLKQAPGNRTVRTWLADRLANRLADAVLQVAEVPLYRKLAELARRERVAMIRSIKKLPFRLSGTFGFNKAEVTAGGVSLDEVDSRDMQSKRCPRLYLVGEVLDIDGPIGGYNFQSAFSTGWLAGEKMASSV